MRQPYCAVLNAPVTAKTIPLYAETRYPEGHVDCIIFARDFACAPTAEHPAAGGVACGLRQRSESRPLARDRLCRRPCGAVDLHPDQPESGAGRPYGRRGSFRLGPEVPVRLWHSSTAARLWRRVLDL